MKFKPKTDCTVRTSGKNGEKGTKLNKNVFQKKLLLRFIISIVIVSMLANIILVYGVSMPKTASKAAVSISFWGDSMMRGSGSSGAWVNINEKKVYISYVTAASVVEEYTGADAYNFGVEGETSDVIAMRAGGLRLSLGEDIYIDGETDAYTYLTDSEGSIVTYDDYSGYGYEENDGAGTSYINGYLVEITNADADDMVKIKLIEDSTADISGVEFAAGSEIVTKASYEHSGDILVLEMGSNGGWDNDYDTLIEQYRSIIENNQSENYIIVGDTDDPGTSLGDLTQTEFNDDGSYVGLEETKWEAALREAFGAHFLNLRTYMIKNGLTDNGLTVTEQDIEYAYMGKLSEQLRSDWTHFNAKGYYSKGTAIYLKGKELGYWS